MKVKDELNSTFCIFIDLLYIIVVVLDASFFIGKDDLNFPVDVCGISSSFSGSGCS